MKPIDLGIASWNSPDKLKKTIDRIVQHTTGEWRLFVIDNQSTDPGVRTLLESYTDDRIIPVFLDENRGYAGAVNKLFELADKEYIVYVDNDAYIETHGWNEIMMNVFETNFETASAWSSIAMVFPKSVGVSYPIQREGYMEILWGIGCFWMLHRARGEEIGLFDTSLGHQEEVDFQMRVRLAGWKIAATTEVQVTHEATSSSNPEAQKRISEGVINWVNKWNKHFTGPHVNYFSPNVTRFEDWMSSYLEEWYLMQPELKEINAEPEQIYVAALGRNVDLIKVPRHEHLYRNRMI